MDIQRTSLIGNDEMLGSGEQLANPSNGSSSDVKGGVSNSNPEQDGSHGGPHGIAEAKPSYDISMMASFDADGPATESSIAAQLPTSAGTEPVGAKPKLNLGEEETKNMSTAEKLPTQDARRMEPTLSLKAIMGANEELERIHVGRTLDNIERWPTKKRGYGQLCSFLLFFALYCCVMVMQMNPGQVFRIDDALRNQVVDEGGALQDVSTLGDLFDYIQEQIMGSVFPGTWYNDDPLTTSESGYVLDYNKLVGGLLIVQRRGVRRKCVEPRYELTNSSYDDFYRVCYTEETTEALIERNETLAKKLPPNSLDYTVPWLPGTPSGRPFDKKDRSSVFGDNPTPTPPPKVVDILAANNRLGNFAESFVYDHMYEGFAAFLAYADGSTKNLAKVEALKQALWLDKYTRGVDIKFAVYNGYVNMFTFVAISFNYGLTGAFKEYQRDSGTQVMIKTVNMEPYRIGGNNPPEDAIKLALEVVLLVWIFNYISSLLREILELGMKEGWNGKAKRNRKTGQIVHVGGLKAFLFNAWTVIDVLNYVLFVWYIIVRIDILSTIYNPDLIISVPTNKYEAVLETISGKLSTQLFLNFANILLCLVRCFKFYRFQPRLAIINKTLTNAFPDLYHFMLMFITVLFGFAVMSHILFGTELWQFNTILESLNTGWMWMAGIGINYAEIARVDAQMSQMYHISFIFLINIVLLNVLLAILVDSYAAATEDTKKEYGDEANSVPSVISDVGEIIRRSIVWASIADHTLKNVLEALEEEGVELATVAQVMAKTPQAVIVHEKLTEAKILANPSVVIVEVDETETRAKKAQAAMDEAFALVEGKPPSRQDKIENALVTQIEELLRENAFLKRQYMVKKKAV